MRKILKVEDAMSSLSRKMYKVTFDFGTYLVNAEDLRMLRLEDKIARLNLSQDALDLIEDFAQEKYNEGYEACDAAIAERGST
jgi:hypothetical protein